MNALRFKGAVSGSLIDPSILGVHRKSEEEVHNYIEEIREVLDRGEYLHGTFFDANLPANPPGIVKRTETHKVIGLCYIGGELHVVVEFSDSPYGKLARGYAHILGLEPVLRIEEGKKPSFDLVISHDKDSVKPWN